MPVGKVTSFSSILSFFRYIANDKSTARGSRINTYTMRYIDIFVYWALDWFHYIIYTQITLTPYLPYSWGWFGMLLINFSLKYLSKDIANDM